MANFDMMCPDHYPMRCNLSHADKDYLLTKEKYKAFLIFQYNDQDEWIQPALEKYFNERTWRLYNAGKEGGTGTKFCNVCRYALASDFGIVSLTPLNYNVHQEIGLMQGFQKPLIYLLNPNHLKSKRGKNLPFDIDDQIYIEHFDKDSLIEGFNNKISLILEKLIITSGFDFNQRNLIGDKVNKLSPNAKELLKRLILEGDPIYISDDRFNNWIKDDLGFKIESVSELRLNRFLLSKQILHDRYTTNITQLNEPYLKYLRELLW
jgi:hypothetical protein